MTTNNTSDNAQAPVEQAAYRRLDDLHWRCVQGGSNKQEQAIALIGACIDEGITSGPRIVSTVANFGLDKRHIGAVLHHNLGHLWHRDGFRIYKTLPPLA